MPHDYSGPFLSDILAQFAATHPNVEVDVFCKSSSDLLLQLEENAIDIALVGSGHGRQPGRAVHREPLVWAGLRHGCAHERKPLPLALSHIGCRCRLQAIEALDRACIEYRIALSSCHHLGQVAAVMGGLAVAPFPLSSVKGDLKVLGKESGLPPIGHFDIELKRSACAVGPLFDALETYVVTFAAANRRQRERSPGTKPT